MTRPRPALAATCLALLLATAPPTAAAQAPTAPVRDPATELPAALGEARALINQGKPKEALEKLAALDAKDPRVAQLQGVACYHADDYAQAIAKLSPILGQLQEGSIERREAVQVLGLSLYLAGRLAEAVPYLEETRAWAKDNLELAYVLGNVYVQTQKPDEARRAFARLFGVSPDSAAAHLLAAQMMVRLEFEEMADAQLRQAIAKDPRIPQAHDLLAQAAIFRGRLDEARALLQKELEVNPADAMALYRLGDAYVRESRWDEGIKALQKSLWLSPYFSGTYILLGKAYLKKGEPATAEGMLRQATRYDPNNRAAHYLLGQVLQHLGRAEESRAELATAEKLPAGTERR
jgi:tetratricopeptide (TPR) repeat protein